jgi:protein-arginine kinase
MSWLSSGIARDWPDGRAVYVNNDKSIFAWINQKDHLRFISWSTNNANNDLSSVIKRFFQGISLVLNRKTRFIVFKFYCLIYLVRKFNEKRRNNIFT